MPEYFYRGRDQEGELKSGKRFAVSSDELGLALIHEGITPIEIHALEEAQQNVRRLLSFFENKTVYLQELSVFSRQMELLYRANVPIVIALKQLARYTKSRRLSEGITGVAEDLERGEDFATALKNYSVAFPEFFINIIEMGQNTGRLNDSFAQIHHYLEFEIQSLKQAGTSFRYPMMLMFVVFITMMGLNYFIIPTFSNLFKNLSMELPWQTQFLIGMSNFFVSNGIYLLLALVVSMWLFYSWISKPKGKRRWHRFLLKVPVYGMLTKTIAVVRFCHGLSVAFQSGLPLTKALMLSAQLVSNEEIKSRILNVIQSVESGKSFTNSVAEAEIFNDLELQIFFVSEQNGELASSLSFVAEFYNREIEYQIKRLSDLMGPLLIAVISVVVVLLALGIYLPIWNMVSIAK